MVEININIWIYYIFAVICALMVHLLSLTEYKRIVNSKRQSINKQIKFLFIVILWFLVVFFCAFRAIEGKYGGTDAWAYKAFFEDATGNFQSYLNRYKDFEIIYMFSNWIIHKITNNYQIYLMIYYSVLVVCLIKYAKMFKLNKYYFLGTVCLMLFLLQSFNLQRNVLAVFLSFFVVDNIRKHKYLKAIVQIVFIMGIHLSAAILFVPLIGLWAIKKFKGEKLHLIVLYDLVASCVILVGISFLQGFLMGTRYDAYIGTGSFAIGNFIGFLFVLTIVWIKKKEIASNGQLLLFVYFYVLFIPIIPLQSVLSIAYRMILFILPISYVVFSEIKIQCLNKSNAKNVFVNLLANVYLLYKVTALLINENELLHIGYYRFDF